MDRLKHRIEIASKALATLEDVLRDTSGNKVVRDAAIQRFEYSFEAIWKTAQTVLLLKFGTALGSPKPVVRSCFENGMLTEEQARLALAMVDHRNLTSHTYNESLADEIFSELAGYATLLRAWLDRLATG